MNAHTKAEELATSTALVEADAGTQVAAFVVDQRAALTDPAKFDAFFDQVKAETDKLDIDLTTEKGRKAIASMAYKVARTKTALDDFGKKLNEDARKQIAVVDEARRRVRERLDALRDEVRRPLTEWEEAEEKRKARCAEVMDRLSAAVVVTIEDTAETVAARLAEVEGLELDEAVFQDSYSMAQGMRANAVDLLKAALARLQREEADRAELERLRAAEAERQAREAEERAAREAEEQARQARNAYGLAMIQHIKGVGMGMIGGSPYPFPILIRELEEKIAIDASLGDHEEEARTLLAATLESVKARFAASLERAAREEEEARAMAAAKAADEAKRAAEETAAAERRQIEETAAAERRRQEAAHAAEVARLQAERDALAAQQAEEERKRKEAEEAERKRASDREHQSKVLGEAKAALMDACKLSEDVARQVVLAIRSGAIPHITLKF